MRLKCIFLWKFGTLEALNYKEKDRCHLVWKEIQFLACHSFPAHNLLQSIYTLAKWPPSIIPFTPTHILLTRSVFLNQHVLFMHASFWASYNRGHFKILIIPPDRNYLIYFFFEKRRKATFLCNRCKVNYYSISCIFIFLQCM